MRKLWFLLLLPAMLALGACGDDDGDTGAGDGTEADGSVDVEEAEARACEVLEAGDVEAAVGRPVSNSQGIVGVPGQEGCTYFLDSDDVEVINVVVYGGDVAQEIFDAVSETGESVEGVGDGAVWGGELSTLHAIEGEQGVMVQLVLAEGADDDLDVASVLAQRVLSGL
jgi:hypothetical protein